MDAEWIFVGIWSAFWLAMPFWFTAMEGTKVEALFERMWAVCRRPFELLFNKFGWE